MPTPGKQIAKQYLCTVESKETRSRKATATSFEGEVLLELSEGTLTFLMIMTRKGNLMPRVCFSSAGHVMKAVVTLVPIISSTDDWIS